MGRPAAHVIEALTEQVAPEHLSYLQNQGVSYLFAGEKRLNRTLLLEKLRRLFGSNSVTSFTQVDFLPSWPPTVFHLKEVQTVVPNVLWVRYTRP